MGLRAGRGTLIALAGPLGAGKTELVKGLAEGLGVSAEEPVVSPTFVLVREYAGRHPLFHCDAYRLGSFEEAEALGLDEMRRAGVLVVEWADRFEELLADADVRIELAHGGASERELTLSADDAGQGPELVRVAAGQARAAAAFRAPPGGSAAP